MKEYLVSHSPIDYVPIVNQWLKDKFATKERTFMEKILILTQEK